MISLELWQFSRVFVSSQWQSADFPDLLRLEVGTSVPPWIKLRVVPLQRGYTVEIDMTEAQGISSIGDKTLKLTLACCAKILLSTHIPLATTKSQSISVTTSSKPPSHSCLYHTFYPSKLSCFRTQAHHGILLSGSAIADEMGPSQLHRWKVGVGNRIARSR